MNDLQFKKWWDKLQKSESIAAWMISASLPKGIAWQIWNDAKRVIYEDAFMDGYGNALEGRKPNETQLPSEFDNIRN